MQRRPQLLAAFTVLLSVCLGSVSVQPLGAQDLADVIEKSERSVVRIEVKGEKGDSLGSGFVVDSLGIIVTNVHVVAGARTATATFANGKTIAIKGTTYYDESRDICIAKLAGKKLKLPKINVSDELPRKGETVTALGAPRGLSFTATNGIVSALRSGDQIGGDRTGTWIQIDAALSPGNSGGPLINAKGNVIAMSTLASTGNSQNLNFGISAKDIRQAIKASRSRKLIPLKDGVGKLETDESSGGGTDSIVDWPAIPDEVVADYVSACRDDFKALSRKIIVAASDADKEYRLIKRGTVPIPRSDIKEDSVVLTDPRSKKRRYFFRSDRVKDREVRKAEMKADELKETKGAIGKTVSNDSLFELLKHTGQFLDTSDKGTIGVLEDGVIIHPYNEHDAVVLFDQQPYLVWLPSTSGLSRGSDIPATTVFVAGTETVRVPGGTTMAVTLLVSLKESDLKKAVYGDAKPGTQEGKKLDAEMRTWTAGKHSVVAKVVSIGDQMVTLEKANGKTIEVKRSILSEVDGKYLSGLE